MSLKVQVIYFVKLAPYGNTNAIRYKNWMITGPPSKMLTGRTNRKLTYPSKITDLRFHVCKMYFDVFYDQVMPVVGYIRNWHLEDKHLQGKACYFCMSKLVL